MQNLFTLAIILLRIIKKRTMISFKSIRFVTVFFLFVIILSGGLFFWYKQQYKKVDFNKIQKLVDKTKTIRHETMGGYIDDLQKDDLKKDRSCPENFVQLKIKNVPINVRTTEASAPVYVYALPDWDKKGSENVQEFCLEFINPMFSLEDSQKTSPEYWSGPFYGKLKILIAKVIDPLLEYGVNNIEYWTKIYQNKDLGISFKYPSFFVIEEEKNNNGELNYLRLIDGKDYRHTIVFSSRGYDNLRTCDDITSNGFKSKEADFPKCALMSIDNNQSLQILSWGITKGVELQTKKGVWGFRCQYGDLNELLLNISKTIKFF